MRKLKILMLNHEFPPVGGGAAPVASELCKYLNRLGHQLDVVTMHYDNLPRFEMKDGIGIYRTPAFRQRPDICHTHEMATYLPGAIGKVLNLITRYRYNIIHCHFIVPGGPLALIASKLTGTPYIVTAHGSDVPGFNPDRFQFQHKFTLPVLRAVCQNAKLITSPSLYLRDLILKNIGDYKIKNVSNGIDLETFKVDIARPKENIILTTGRLLQRKGFHTLIRAVRDIELPFELHICGDGPYRDHLEKLAEGSRTKVVFHGWLRRRSKKLLELYEKASIYALVSSHENASISLLEGMAAGCAMITTNTTGCAETVSGAGFLIEFEDSHRLREILIKLSRQPGLAATYGRKARHRIMNCFHWEKIARQYIEIYSS